MHDILLRNLTGTIIYLTPESANYKDSLYFKIYNITYSMSIKFGKFHKIFFAIHHSVSNLATFQAKVNNYYLPQPWDYRYFTGPQPRRPTVDIPG